MAPVESPAGKLRRLKRAGDIEQKSNKHKPRHDGDDECAVCDNGGNVTCCEGGCQRSFHLADDDSEESKCRLALGLTKEQAKMIIDTDPEEPFICKNCEYKQHQCFVCGLLGSSDLSSGAEVFQCEDDDCGHFYHPKCVAELLYPDSEFKASLFESQVFAGVEFRCLVHECSVCRGGENKDDENMKFAVCKRCPATYHRKCLPSDIPFKTKKGPNGYMRRAWDDWVGPDGDIIPRDRILIYCTKHDIIRELEAPKRNHIIFPDAKKLRVPKMLVGPPMEEDMPEEEEVRDHPSSEPSQPSVVGSIARDQNQCSCSSPMDAFAPKSLFMHPHPGSCGWLGD